MRNDAPDRYEVVLHRTRRILGVQPTVVRDTVSEYPPGQALDQARVLRLDGSLTVPFGTFGHLLVTSERSLLEPQTEQKYYAPGVNEIAERVVKGHREEFRLTRVTPRAPSP